MSLPGCQFGLYCEFDDLAVRLQPLFAIGSEIPAQLTAFLNKLFQLGIHPGNFYDSALFRKLQKASNRFDRDPTDNTALILLWWHLWKRPICFGVVWASSGMDTLHLNVLIPDKQQRKVV